MKILYIKNNSERAKAFQLKTVIYEENGQKYVRKEALNRDAIPHLKKMKESYAKLTAATLDPNIAFAKIIDEDEKSLTFEFIDGISFEKKFQAALSLNNDTRKELIQEYMDLLKTSFSVTQFDNQTMVTDEFKTIFGDLDFSSLDGQLCFEGISNIDLIFSNIIYKDNKIYFIDYEWSYDISLPVDYCIDRTLEMLPVQEGLSEFSPKNTLMYRRMERYFVDKYVMKNSFYFQKHQYVKVKTSITKHIQNKVTHIQQLEAHIQEITVKLENAYTKLDDVGKDLSYARAVIDLRDRQIEALRLKNRVKDLIKKVLPGQIPLGIPTTIEKTVSSELGYTYNEPILTEDTKSVLDQFSLQPLISIIMPVYNVDPKWLKKAIDSIEAQWYVNWELCIADDKSSNEDTLKFLHNLNNPKIKVTYLSENCNISGASNEALKLSSGEYIALMDNDDEITPNALYEMVKSINDHDAEFIYSDEDFISAEGVCSNPHFKPDFSPDLLLSHNYITHFTCFKKELLEKVGYFDSKFDGSQDYDLFLRLTEKTSKIYHIQKVLYHWRTIEGSTSADSEAKPEALERGKLVLENTLRRRKIDATVEYANMHHYFRVKYDIKDNPLVSIIIPFKDKPELLDTCVNSILDHSTYQNFEIIGISNNSEDPAIFSLMVDLENKDSRVSMYEYNTEFNYADINNYAVRTYAKGEHILLLNNDIEVISPSWIESMLEHSQRDEVGCVGAKLYYPNDTVQHAGVIIGLGGYAGHSHKMSPRENPGYFNRLSVVQNLSAVTAACLMIKKRVYQKVDGMDEVKFKVAYNDVDFCLRVLEKGYLNILHKQYSLQHIQSGLILLQPSHKEELLNHPTHQ